MVCRLCLHLIIGPVKVWRKNMPDCAAAYVDS